ncbi:TldD/PmbA family protein [Aureimonas mangrovi]|uniref:TldD/PmbA family protein n=1 Tax=Aureimonas mangrovi TaxID=2758041 RepID=UPI00163D9BC2|nr:TldD/PmbA family protein [Aureimonas mangrovi]
MIEDGTARLLDVADRLMTTAKRFGADAADAAVIRSHSRSVQVRLGTVEATESSESEDLTLRVFVDGRVASVAADGGADVERLVERAIAMARVSPVDPFASLADAGLLATDDLDLDLFDDTDVAADRLREDALAAEDAARAVDGVTNSGGASASAGFAGLVLVTSGGFSGARRRSGFSRSVSVLAGEGTGMQRDYDFDSRIHFSDLEEPEAIGRQAGERAVRRLNPRSLPTGRRTIVFDPRVARGFVGHLVSALNGASIARGTSFLKDRMGRAVLPAGIDVRDEPLLARRAASRPFDGEGVRGASLSLVEDGVLASWLLDTATARELGLQTNGRAMRSGGGVSPGATNVVMTQGAESPDDLLAAAEGGIYVTELIGSGANLVTGDYSRGASGFLIEGGQLGGPVSELTIAGHLSEMFMALRPANDADERYQIVAPTLHLGEMTVAGR